MFLYPLVPTCFQQPLYILTIVKSGAIEYSTKRLSGTSGYKWVHFEGKCIQAHTISIYHASIHNIMQVSVYVKEEDYESLSSNKPAEFKTTSSYMSDVLRKKAEDIREQQKVTSA